VPASRLDVCPWQLFELSHGFSLGGDFLAQFAAGFGFAVKSLRSRGGPRVSLSSRTFTSKSPPSLVIRNMFPMRTSRASLRAARGLNPAEVAGLCG